MDLNSNNFDPQGNFNRATDEKFFSKIQRSANENFRKLSLISKLSLIIFPLLFMFIGIFYRNSCPVKAHQPLYLIIFGILILLNFSIYLLMGTNFFALLRHSRSFSLDKGVGMFLTTLLGIVFGVMIFIWWIIGMVWWIKLIVDMTTQLKHSTSLSLCHPIVYWAVLVTNMFGLIGFIIQICIAINGTSKPLAKNRLNG